MNKNLLINTITRNAPNKLDGLLASIGRNHTLKRVPILVVDDSSPESRENHRVVSGHRHLDITHVDSQEWEKYKAKILPFVKSDFIRRLRLGRETWNTPDVRNICQVLVLSIMKKTKKILYFDDDMHVDDLYMSMDLLTKSIQGIPIMGCPDLSRFEWMQLYLRFLAERNGVSITNQLQYVDELMMKYGQNIVGEFIRRYTDLNMEQIEIFSESDIPEFIPSREEVSGGAYINSRENLCIGTFPVFYNEDWCYAHMIKTHTRVGNVFYPYGVIHNSSIKSILDGARLRAEEEGEFFQQYYRGNESFDPHELIKKMKEIIAHEIGLGRKLLHSLGSQGISVIQAILEALHNLYEIYEQLEMNAGKYISIYEQHTQDNQHWQQIVPLLESLNLSPESLAGNEREKILIVSPHIDDAFLSLGGYIGSSTPGTIEIVNVFSISNYTSSGTGNISEVTQQRKNEEDTICRAYGIMPYFLDYVDAILRVGGEEEDYINPNHDPTTEEIYQKLKTDLRERFHGKGYSRIYFPLGIGNHVDHEMLFRIGVELQKEGIPISFYEEVGYEEALDSEKVQQKALLIPGFQREVLPIKQIADKIMTVGCYVSQMSTEIEELVRKSQKVNGGEAIWTPY